eukprot:7875054-Pyramimonas_sp.AAC.1
MHQLLHGETVPLNIAAAMLRVKKVQCEDLIGQRAPDLDDMGDARVEETEDPFPAGADGGTPAAAQPQ